MDNLEHFFENVDVYDSFKNITGGYYKKKPDYVIDVGLDYKMTLMNKGAGLGLYGKFVEADANGKLPFTDESFQTVFSNIIYWLNNPADVFKEIYRILKKGGECCVMLPNYAFLESSFYYSLYEKAQRKEFEFLQLIDRGRVKDNIKVVKTYDEWKKIIEEAGFEIKECVPHLSKTLIRIWDIGLRPIFPMLKKMTEHLDEDSLLEIKKEWTDLFMRIGLPIIENDNLLAQGEEFCFFCFIMKK